MAADVAKKLHIYAKDGDRPVCRTPPPTREVYPCRSSSVVCAHLPLTTRVCFVFLSLNQCFFGPSRVDGLLSIPLIPIRFRLVTEAAMSTDFFFSVIILLLFCTSYNTRASDLLAYISLGNKYS